MFSQSLLTTFMDFIFGFIEGIIGVRIMLKFFGANVLTPFVSWVYDIASPLIFPFQGIFPNIVTRRGYVIEISAIVALLIYALVGYFIEEALRFLEIYKQTRITNSAHLDRKTNVDLDKKA